MEVGSKRIKMQDRKEDVMRLMGRMTRTKYEGRSDKLGRAGPLAKDGRSPETLYKHKH